MYGLLILHNTTFVINKITASYLDLINIIKSNKFAKILHLFNKPKQIKYGIVINNWLNIKYRPYN